MSVIIKNGYSRKTVKENTATLVSDGFAPKTAYRIAADAARKSYFARYPEGALPLWLAYPDGTRMQKEKKKGTKKVFKKNPASRAEIEEGENLYREFTGHEPGEHVRLKVPKAPRVAILVGDLIGIAYGATRDGKRKEYFHEFSEETRPLLASTSDGSGLHILGGEYDFTAAGIVDANDAVFPRA